MVPPKYQNTANITTIVSLVNLAILVFIGGGAYATLRAADQSLAEQALRIEQRLTVHDTQIDSMRTSAAASAVSLGRIEENVGELRNDIERILRAVITE